MAKRATGRRGDGGESPEVRITRLESILESLEENVSKLDAKLTVFIESIKAVISEAQRSSMELHELRCKQNRLAEQKACQKQLEESFVRRVDYEKDIAAAKVAAKAAETSDIDYKKVWAVIILALTTLLTVSSNFLVEKHESSKRPAVTTTPAATSSTNTVNR